MFYLKNITGILNLKSIINLDRNKTALGTVKKQMSLDNNGLEIIKTHDKWNALLEEIGIYDFYHTYDYHMIEQQKEGFPVMLKYAEDDIIIGMPFLIRKITGTDYYDATSVYGYAGPISKNVSSGFDNSMFLEKLHAFFVEHKIISVFSRLHPYFNNQKDILKNYGNLINQGKVVNIDLNLNLYIQHRNYQDRLRTYVNGSRKNSFVKKLESGEELREFVDIYLENMMRVNASKYFCFDEEYFTKLLNSTQFKAEILLVKEIKSGKTIAGSLFVTTNNIVQYHLSGTRFEFLHLTPTKLLIDEMRIIATKRGTQFFNLGGGLGGKFNDSLFRFKSSFSKDFRDFHLWNVVVNQTHYDKLVEKQRITETSFFPKYRFGDKNLVTSAD